jgi:hypothetical protein
MTSFDPRIGDALDREVPLRSALEPAWDDVLRRAEAFHAGRTYTHWWVGKSRRWRPVLVAAVAVAALVGAAVAIAAGFGAFNGISAAQHLQTPADKIDPSIIARINGNNGIQGPGSQLLADSSRLLRQLSGGGRLYVVARKDGGLCVLAVGLSGTESGPSAMGCGSPLTQSQPTTISSFKAKQGTPTVNWGIALDHINAISFDLGGQELTVPVTNNAWAYEGLSPRLAQSIVIHYDDGTTRSLTP